mmetsp:Transcript_19906/g.49636  ORF Transcript_19906/g.49636 Transcript_19906/m.49636 type:complete len:236 (+) Transcript_19906:1457-2164(+)
MRSFGPATHERSQDQHEVVSHTRAKEQIAHIAARDGSAVVRLAERHDFRVLCVASYRKTRTVCRKREARRRLPRETVAWRPILLLLASKLEIVHVRLFVLGAVPSIDCKVSTVLRGLKCAYLADIIQLLPNVLPRHVHACVESRHRHQLGAIGDRNRAHLPAGKPSINDAWRPAQLRLQLRQQVDVRIAIAQNVGLEDFAILACTEQEPGARAEREICHPLVVHSPIEHAHQRVP